MSLNSDLLVRMGRFLDDELSYAELVGWVQDHEPYWTTLPRDSMARLVAGTIMLASYEVDDGARSPESLKGLLSEASLQPVSG